MVLYASSKLRPRAVALQKLGLAVVLEHTEAAVANGSLPPRPLRPRYRAKLRVHVHRPTEAGQDQGIQETHVYRRREARTHSAPRSSTPEWDNFDSRMTLSRMGVLIFTES